jgi:formylglycine-generating enzyme
MVTVPGRFCIDRYEVSLIEQRKGFRLSPHYTPDRVRSQRIFEHFAELSPKSGTAYGRTIAVPPPLPFPFDEEIAPLAKSEKGVLPQGYLTRDLAEKSCVNAGKRLCRRDEWVSACRGEHRLPHPYGSKYEAGACNVHRKSHPATLLHGNPSHLHQDPRLGLVEDEDGPLLRPTGATPRCKSEWAEDAIFDMVGNIDEWIDEPAGSFLGGFFSRGTQAGCDASIDLHDASYLDYSLGARCCRDLGQ